MSSKPFFFENWVKIVTCASGKQ